MYSQNPTSINGHLRSNCFGARWMLSIVLSIAVLFGQSLPTMAGPNNVSSASWVEICGDGGSHFILVDANGQEQSPDCEHCDYCLVSIGDVQDGYYAPVSGSALIGFKHISYSGERVDLPENPEQYWSASRGPPIASTENIMTTYVSLFGKEPAAISSSKWSTPCV